MRPSTDRRDCVKVGGRLKDEASKVLKHFTHAACSALFTHEVQANVQTGVHTCSSG